MRDEYDFSNAKRNPYAKKLKKQITINIDENLFVIDAEKSLYKAIKSVEFDGDYNKYLQDLININPVVTKFFDNVLVMDKDEKIKNNRLALLSELKNKYIMLTDFSKLNG